MRICLAVLIGSLGLASVQPNNEAVTGYDNALSKIQQNFLNFFDSIGKNDAKQGETYRTILEKETRQEQQAFDSMKNEFRSVGLQKNVKQGRLDNKISHTDEEGAALKREARKNVGAITTTTSKLPPLPEDGASWADIRDLERGMVDKTLYLLKMLKMPINRFFMARPRRFGKTVFIEMLSDFFKGHNLKRFNGLEIEKVGNVENMRLLPERLQTNKPKWVEFPVITINFVHVNQFTSLENFREMYQDLLSSFTREHGIAYERKEQLTLSYLIRELHLKFDRLPVVVLIDEYDAPVEYAVHTLKNKTLVNNIIGFIDHIFGEIKNNRLTIGFAFVTGICKIPLQSMGSGAAGAFKDLTYDPEMATAFGFTVEEINTQLGPYLDRFANKLVATGKSEDSCHGEKKFNKARGDIVRDLIKWYNGYHFNGKDPKAAQVLNPVSTCRSLEEYEFTDHCGRTRNINFIVKTFYESKLQWRFLDFKRPKGYTMDLSEIPGKNVQTDISETSLPVLMLLYGYLTPIACDIENKTVTLAYPNLEVVHHLENALSKYVPETEELHHHKYFGQFFRAMRIGNVAEAIEILQKFEFIVYSYPSNANVTPEELTRRLNSLLNLCGIAFREGLTFAKDDPSKNGNGGDIDFLTLNLDVNYAISVKCTSRKVGNAMGAIGQLVGYLEGETSNPESFKKAVRDVNVKTEEIYLLALGFTYANGGTLDNWIFLPYRDDRIQYAEVHASSEGLKEDFLKTYAPQLAAHTTLTPSNLSTS